MRTVERGNLWRKFIMNVGRATPWPAGNFLLQLNCQYPITNGKTASSFLSKIQPLFFNQMLLFVLAASELSWSDTSLPERDGFSFPTCLLRIHSVNLEDTFPADWPSSTFLSHAEWWSTRPKKGVFKTCPIQGYLPSQRKGSGKQNKLNTWCCMLTGLALGCWKLCMPLGRWARQI